MRALTVLVLLCGAAARPLIRNIRDSRELDKLLKHHADVTGLPVVIDFFSQTCGPCIMIAPKFKELAREYEGRVKFVKVDVQRDYVGIQVRSMPTFHFYLQGKLENQFSGADENGMRQYTQVPPPAIHPL